MKIGWILNSEECTRTASSSSTNLRKAEIFLSIFFKSYESNTNGNISIFCQFCLVPKNFKLSPGVFFHRKESKKSFSLATEQFFFDENYITDDWNNDSMPYYPVDLGKMFIFREYLWIERRYLWLNDFNDNWEKKKRTATHIFNLPSRLLRNRLPHLHLPTVPRFPQWIYQTT